MAMEILAAESTNLFIGTEADPRQVVRIWLRGMDIAYARGTAIVRVEGEDLRTAEPVAFGPLGPGVDLRLEVGVETERPTIPGSRLLADVVVEDGSRTVRRPFEFVVEDPGWRMFMVAHFHYDAVWWNTQAGYAESWGTAIRHRPPFQEPGFALVKAHLEMARRDPDYKFVLAELDYLKPYWDVFPEDRGYLRQLFKEDRLELVGGTYNEPNTNLTSAESTIRNAIYGVAYQRDVLAGAPSTAWQLDAFGHDPQFPGIMADAGLTSSSWARGPFHEYGPNWVPPVPIMLAEMAAGERPRMQFPTEFEWIAPSGRALLTSFLANHYSAGWSIAAATSLEQAEAEAHRLFTELASLSATNNVLLPVGSDYMPPNRWLTAIHRDWNRRYLWPRFVAAIPREFFDAVRKAQARTGRPFSPQTRDMNPIYSGTAVSFIDTKQAQRIAENTLLSAEKFATIAALHGARFPTEAIDKAWRQLLFGAHHDGITGSASDQVYLDLLGGWREALELGTSTLHGALAQIGTRIGTAGEGRAVTVFNPLSWSRTDYVRVTLDLTDGQSRGVEIHDDAGASLPFVLEAAERTDDGTIRRATLVFIATGVPALGYRTYRAVPRARPLDDAGWQPVESVEIANDTYALTVDPERGGAISSLIDRRTGKQILQAGRVGNELLVYREYPTHPLFGEGPWQLTPDGRVDSSVSRPVDVVVEASPIGRRIRVEGPFDGCRLEQEITLWDGLDRVELTTRLHGYSGQDRLFRVRFAADIGGGTPISEVGNAVVGRAFGNPNVDVANVPFTLDNSCYDWFALGTTAQIALADDAESATRASRAIGVAEVISPGDPGHDDAVRNLVVALVQQGVTSTLSQHDGSRYGVLYLDSNLPDLRLAIGGPADNRFVATVLESAGAAYGAELERQLAECGWARLWIPAASWESARSAPIPDLRGARDLPVLVVAGADSGSTVGALRALADDLADGVIRVQQPRELDGSTSAVENFTVAILNRGLPGFNVEADGSMYLSLMRSCSGWPSGVWIDPPHRSAPDGSNFQLQHWSHTFEYALVASAGDWRSGEVVRSGHDYNNPLLARVSEPHAGELPATASLVAVEPASVVLTVLKPTGNPQARMAGADLDPINGLTVRLYESAGRQTTATIRCRWPIAGAVATNILEETSRPLTVTDGVVGVMLEPFEISTTRLQLPTSPPSRGPGPELAPRSEPAQPVFSDYWMHNKGAAPMGYQPVTVQIRPSIRTGAGPFAIPVVVASERTDHPTEGSVAVIVPPGWKASPAERPFQIAPGAHVEFEVSVVPANGAAAGRYFVAARITDEAGQSHEDIVTLDHRPGQDGDGGDRGPAAGSPVLGRAIDRALRAAGIEPDPPTPFDAMEADDFGEELVVELLTHEISVIAGEKAEVHVALRNRAASEIRGEAQIVSPHETWPFISPWTQGFVVGPDEERRLTFGVDPRYDMGAGVYWALVKVMYFGRLRYTESLPIEILSSPAARNRVATQRPS